MVQCARLEEIKNPEPQLSHHRTAITLFARPHSEEAHQQVPCRFTPCRVERELSRTCYKLQKPRRLFGHIIRNHVIYMDASRLQGIEWSSITGTVCSFISGLAAAGCWLRAPMESADSCLI